MVNAVIILVSIILFIFYLIDMKNNRLDTKKMVMVGMTCAISSLIYNVSSSGVEGLVVIIVITMIPLNRINRVVNKTDLFEN